MAIIAHLAMLEEKHSKLDDQLTAESHRPMPDFNLMQTLKKQKLLIKQEITRLKALTQERFDAA